MTTLNPASANAARQPEFPSDEEVDTTVEALPVEAKAAEPAKPQHSPRLARAAANLGFNRDAIAAMSTEELEDIIYEQTVRIRALQDESARNADANPISSQERERAPEPETDELAAVDPIIAARLRRAEANEKRAEALEKRLEENEKRERLRLESSLDEKIDAAFTSLGDEYAAIFGTESSADIKGTAEIRRRQAVFSAAGIDLSKGLPGPATLKSKLLAAAKDIFGPVVAARAKAEPEAKPKTNSAYIADPDETPVAPAARKKAYSEEEWAEGALARPTQRQSKPARGTDAAKKLYRALTQDMDAERQDDGDDDRV